MMETMREFAADEQTTVHPQTVIEHFGSWNAAKRSAGLVPRRFATREELLGLLKELGEELGRTPTARDIDERKGKLPSKSLYWHTFGSLANALREARKQNGGLLTEWQVYRMFDARRGAWSTFQFLVRERLDEQGTRVGSDGRLL